MGMSSVLTLEALAELLRIEHTRAGAPVAALVSRPEGLLALFKAVLEVLAGWGHARGVARVQQLKPGGLVGCMEMPATGLQGLQARSLACAQLPVLHQRLHAGNACGSF